MNRIPSAGDRERPGPAGFDLSRPERDELLSRLAATLEQLTTQSGTLPVSRKVTVEQVRAELANIDFDAPESAVAAFDTAVGLLGRYAVHVPHPRYFGLFNPAPTFMSVLGDSLAAAFNPQLAAWSHAPAAAEVERKLVGFLAERLGLPRAAGSFTSGGAEANQTGMLVALTGHFPEFTRTGLRGLAGPPTFYASTESHHSWIKIARATGLGEDALRLVPVGADLRMDVGALASMIGEDRAAGRLPFLIAATAGTTSAGAIDPLNEVADLADSEDLHLHVDAAWAGAAALSDDVRPILNGIERADSVTIDAHKWLSVPMGAGVFLSTDQERLRQTFAVATTYMPRDTDNGLDPYATSIQWSRRFIGLKLFLSLMVAGRAGYARQLEHDCRLGDKLRELVTANGWTMANSTPLPVLCFTDRPEDSSASASPRITRIVDLVVERGQAWISATHVGGTPVVRACIISHRTTDKDLHVLMGELEAARSQVDRSPDRPRQQTQP